jgi:signal transduction histidine kinase
MTSLFDPTSRQHADHPLYKLSLTTSGGVTLLLGCAAVLALLLVGSPQRDQAAAQAAIVASITIVVLTLDRSLARRYGEKPPLAVSLAAIGLHAALVEAMTLIDGLTYTSILYLTLPFPVFFMLGRRAGIAVSVGLLVWVTLKFALFKPGWLDDPAAMNSYVLFLIALILIAAMAHVVQRERANRLRAEDLLADLEASHIKLARYADQVAELAAIEERNRLARDIHDSLGHHLTVIGVQLEKAVTIHHDSPDPAWDAVRSAKRLADQALTDVRHSVAALRQEATPFRLRPALESLVANGVDLPLHITLEISGDESLYSAQQLSTLYRAAQEGLTNVVRHAEATRVVIGVDLGASEAVLCVIDDGRGPDHAANPGGFGLRGLRERLEQVGGWLSLIAAPNGGAELRVCVPGVGRAAG